MRRERSFGHLLGCLPNSFQGVGADRRTVDNWLDNNSAFDQLLQSLATTTGGDNTTVTEIKDETKTETEAPKAPAFGRL